MFWNRERFPVTQRSTSTCSSICGIADQLCPLVKARESSSICGIIDPLCPSVKAREEVKVWAHSFGSSEKGELGFSVPSGRAREAREMSGPVIPMLLLLTWCAKRFWLVVICVSLVFWSGGLLGHDVFKRFGKMIWERGNRLKTGFQLWKGFIKSLWF